ncbi:MAG: permease [Gammaproteobacteria bacterium]|nr:permease [Gammaproteobacteria bacterium]
MVVYHWLGAVPGSRSADSVHFFIYDSIKIMMLLSLVIFIVGIVRSFIDPEKVRRFLADRAPLTSNMFSASFGIITPFCSCSAIPVFVGFMTAGVPLGATFSFLVSSPMINEVALILLYGLLGWKIALLYLATGWTIAVVSGFILGKLKLEKHVEGWVYEEQRASCCQEMLTLNWGMRIQEAWQSVKDIVGKVWVFMLIGIAIGGAIHGYVPQTLMAHILGHATWWSVPLAILIGVPLYSNAAGVIPVVEALLSKGAALGSVLAFMMSVVALSLPEMLILRRVLKPKLLAIFVTIVTLGILLIGFLFNALLM